MKKLIVLTILSLLGYLNADAQTTASTKIYILNASGGIGKLLRIQPAGATKKTIDIKSSHWAIIQLNADSLGLLTNDKPYFMHFERGKSYYFVAHSDYFPVFLVNELSEREFLLTVHANNSGKPEEYTLDNQQ